METTDLIGNMPSLIIIGITVFVFIIIIYGIISMYVKNNRDNKMILSHNDRYEYPKKECTGNCEPECDCFGNLKYNGELEDVYLDNKEDEVMKGLIKECQMDYRDNGTLSITVPGRYSNNELTYATTIDCKEYMKRKDKVYFRGHNVKLVLTVNNE